jgi:hypothetical protein
MILSVTTKGQAVETVRHPSADLAAARQAYTRATHTLRALLAAAGSGDVLCQYVEQAKRGKRELERVISELEERDGGPHRRMADLFGLCERAKKATDWSTFELRRQALWTLGFKALANGDDPARWRYETSTW